jgi:two-component system OmpR family sensor kinase
MFEQTVASVFIATLVGALATSVALATLLARRISRPLQRLGWAVRRIAEGDYAARVDRAGPEEIASLADSFNQMAERLEDQERQRREFIANAAHELRTPLTNLQGYLEALRDGVLPVERATFESLHEEADRLVRLSRSLDALAEGELVTGPPVLRDLDLAAAIATAVELSAPGFERRAIRVDLDVAAGLRARANPDHLAQVLANLLQNAVRYTPEGGRVAIAAVARPGDVLVSVTNTGEGIPAAELPRVFERFYRVEKSRDRARGGAGIGLAIVKRLVELGGGRVGAESRGGLTRFWFSLPG